MGVELGKVLAKNILKQLDKPEDVTGHDSSVRALHRSMRVADADRSSAVSPLSRPPASSTTIRSGAKSDW